MTHQHDEPAAIVIDDNQDHAHLLAQLLSKGIAKRRVSFAHEPMVFADPVEAIAALPADRMTVVLTDYQLSGSTALDWMQEIVRRDPGPVLVLTAHGDEQIAANAFRHGATDYLIKGEMIQNPDLLYQAINDSIRRYRLAQSNRDLSRKLKIINNTLREKNQHLIEMSETAHRFVDDVAHDFRSPLAVIQEFASILTDEIGGPINPKQREFLDHITAATGDLSRLIDDFLDSSRLKHRALRVHRGPHSAGEMFDRVRAELETRARRKGIALRERIEPGLPDAFCDLDKTARIITNLAINAIKFSPPDGRIELFAETADDGDVLVGVADNGPGIEAQELKMLGQRFSQLKHVPTDRVKGYGLGLSIAAELANLNLGRMRIDSTPGAGSTFAFTLPTCDPQQITARYLAIMLAQNPRVALTVLQASPRRHHPDDAAALRRQLAGICFPMDLLLTGSQRDRIILIGATNEPDHWLSRLREASDQPDAVPCDIRWLGTWSGEQLEQSISHCVTDQLLGLRAAA